MTNKNDIFESTQETFNRIINEHYFPEDDKHNQIEMSDTRRPRLTLRHLNKLRKIQELKRLETEAHSDFVKTMYGTPAEGDEPGF